MTLEQCRGYDIGRGVEMNIEVISKIVHGALRSCRVMVHEREDAFQAGTLGVLELARTLPDDAGIEEISGKLWVEARRAVLREVRRLRYPVSRSDHTAYRVAKAMAVRNRLAAKGLPHEAQDIARELGCPVGHVRARLKAAKGQIAAQEPAEETSTPEDGPERRALRRDALRHVREAMDTVLTSQERAYLQAIVDDPAWLETPIKARCSITQKSYDRTRMIDKNAFAIVREYLQSLHLEVP